MKNRSKNGSQGVVCAIFVAMGLALSEGCADSNGEKDQKIQEIAENGNSQEALEGETEESGGAAHNIPAAEEEKQAAPVTADGYLIDLPESGWIGEPNLWCAADNELLQIWTALYASREEAEQILGDVGYTQMGGDMQKTESGLRYHVRIKEAIEGVWCLFYRYPEEMKDVYAGELSEIADTFAVTATKDDKYLYGYITKFASGSVTVDQKKWVTPESKEWNASYDQDAGFAVVDIDSEDAAYALVEDCTFSVLENHQGPPVGLDVSEFETYWKDAENPILWVMEMEDGQIKHVAEQYMP